MEKRIVDLRSDTVTKPSAAMRKAMAEAEVGDDVYGEDPTVNLLEQEGAKVMGKEAALYVPSGTMGNLIAILAHCQERGSEIILGANSHIYYYEVGSASAVGGVSYHTIEEDAKGFITPEQVLAAIRKENVHFPVTRLLCLENTHNRAGGTIMPLEHTARLCEIAHSHNMKVHLDGARLFNAAVALKRDVKHLVEHFDSVQFCLSKGLGAPIGSLLVGTAAFIKKARHLRKMLGGGMRQAGVIAAAGLMALREGPARLENDHQNCRKLAELLSSAKGISIQNKVETNMLYVSTATSAVPDAAKWAAELKARGILCNATGDHSLRFVTHLDVSESDIAHAAAVIASVGDQFGVKV